MTDKTDLRVITPEAILSFPHLFTPQPNDAGDLQFSASFIFLAGSDITDLQRKAVAAGQAKWGDQFAIMYKNGQIRMPFRTDGESKGYPEGSTFISARTKMKPGIVQPFAGPDGKPVKIDDQDEVYPGLIVRASLTAFAYDKKGNKGVSFALNNIQKLRDGERLDSRVAAQDEFDAPEGQQQTASLASLEDLM